MNKTIKINFIYLPEKDGTSIQENIKQFYTDILIAYINNLTCSYNEKRRIVEHINALTHNPKQH